MYELNVQIPKDRNIWIQSIKYDLTNGRLLKTFKFNSFPPLRAAVLSCHSENNVAKEYMTDEQLSLAEAKHSTLKDLIGKCCIQSNFVVQVDM